MSIAHDTDAVTVEELSEEQGRELFERACQKELGVSASEFLLAHDRGEYPAEWRIQSVQRVEFLLPFAG